MGNLSRLGGNSVWRGEPPLTRPDADRLTHPPKPTVHGRASGAACKQTETAPWVGASGWRGSVEEAGDLLNWCAVGDTLGLAGVSEVE
jgi:hypothetical protein